MFKNQNWNSQLDYFEVTEEGAGVLEFPLNIEGDHPRTSSALFLHHFVLGVRGQACVERQNSKVGHPRTILVNLHFL